MALKIHQPLIFISIILFLNVFDIISCQRRYSEVGDPFGGVRYSSSRVASTYQRRYPVGTNATEKPAAKYVQPTTTESPQWTTSTPSSDEIDDALWYATSTTFTTTTDKPPKSRTRRPKSNHETLADWRNRFYGTFVGSSRRRPAVTTPEYTTIEEGSYYDRPSSSAAPAKLVATSDKPFFNWDGRHHRHHHGSKKRPETKGLGPEKIVEQEFESRSATTVPPPTTTTSASTTTTRRIIPVHTGRQSTLDPLNSKGSVWYHKKKEQPPTTHRRQSENVIYVSGSYFPYSDRLRKPQTGYFLGRNEVKNDETSPAPEILTYPTRTIRIRYFPGATVRTTTERDYDYDDNVHPFASISGK